MKNIRLYLIKTEDLEKAISLNLIAKDFIWAQGETTSELTLTKDQFGWRKENSKKQDC